MNPPFDESKDPADIPDNRYRDFVELNLDIFGKLLHICIGVKEQPAMPSDIIPLARFLSAKIVSVVKQIVRNNGGTIPCRAGCSQCCRYLVPVAIHEALRLAEEVAAMEPAKRIFVNERCILTAKRVLELTPKSSLDKSTNTKSGDPGLLKDVSDWYPNLGLSCPFLFNDQCTIYEQRLITCW